MGYVMRHGRRIEVVTINPDPCPIPKRRRKSFEPWFVKLPRHWISALRRSKSARTYELAHIILWEAFKNERGTPCAPPTVKWCPTGGEVRKQNFTTGGEVWRQLR